MHPRSTIPQALAATVVIVVLTYTVPIVVGCAHLVGVDQDGGGSGSGSASSLVMQASSSSEHPGSGDDRWSNWRDGYFTTVAQQIGGKWLGMWLLSAAALSAMGQYLAEMSSNSFQLEGMAQRRQLPSAFRFGHRSKHGTPTSGIIGSLLICVLMGVVDIDMVIEATNCLYCVAALLEFAAFLRLRCICDTGRLSSSLVNDSEMLSDDRTEEEARYIVPLGTFGCACMLLPAAAAIVLVRTPSVIA